MDWDKLRIFYTAAATGNLTHAGHTLNLSQSAVSRHITALEHALQAPLFHRHARGLVLTEQGEVLYSTVREVAAQLTSTKAVLDEVRSTPRGEISISTDAAFGAFWLVPHLKRFTEQFPDIRLTIRLNGGESNLVMREADVAITMTVPHQPDLVRLPLFTHQLQIYAASNYLARCGHPKTVTDLDHHQIVAYTGGGRMTDDPTQWLLEVGADRRTTRQPIMTIDDISGAIRATESGMGIGIFPPFAIGPTSKMVRILPDFPTPETTAYFTYPAELRSSKRIRVFRDFLVEEMRKDPP